MLIELIFELGEPGLSGRICTPTKDGSTVRYVQNLRTTYLEPYRTSVPNFSSIFLKRTVPLQKMRTVAAYRS